MNSDKELHFSKTKINVCFKFSRSNFNQHNFMRASFCGCIKNYSWVLPWLNHYSLGGMAAPRGETKHPKLDRKQVTIPVFLIHCLCYYFWVYLESCLIALFNNKGLHIWSLLEVNYRGAAFGEYSFNTTSALSMYGETCLIIWDKSLDSPMYSPLTYPISIPGCSE